MNIPFLDLRTQYLELKNEIDASVARVLDSGWYIMGGEVEQFEAAFRDYLTGGEGGYVIGVNSGTDALKLALLAAGVGPGDEVVTVPNTAIPTVTAICSTGAVPVFCDVHPETWLMDTARLEACITKRTRAIIPVHLYGASCDMDGILSIASARGITVVEDVAQATGATFRNRKCGTIGDFGAFSFYPSKNLGACGDGGALFVRSPEARDTLLKLRNYGQSSRYVADLAHGENSRLDEVQAAILKVKLGHLDRWNQLRHVRAGQYRRLIADSHLPVALQQENSPALSAHHLFVIRLEAGKRESVMVSLREQGVESLIHYPHPIYRQPAFACFSSTLCPVAEELSETVLSLPFHQYLSKESIRYVVEKLGNALT